MTRLTTPPANLTQSTKPGDLTMLLVFPDPDKKPSGDLNIPADPSAQPLANLRRWQQWVRAYDSWLDSRRSAHTRRAYTAAWQQFRDFTGKHIWEINKVDVVRWTESLRRQGMAPETVNQRLAAVSSFFTYAMRIYTVLDADGREKPLHHYNPVHAVPRPQRSPYNKARYLSVAEARAFLKAIPRTTLQGRRDYALFLAYLITGRRNSEIRNLRYGDFEVTGSLLRGQKVFYRWQGKGKSRRDECPLPVWTAVQEFLSSAGRLDDIAPGDFIFTPLNNNATRLPNVSGEAWDPNRPLSMRLVGALVNKYALRAGLDPRKISVHTLRHTAAMLRKQAGDDLEAISAFLGHSNLAVTQIYLHTLEGRSDQSWARVEKLLGL